MKINVFMTVMAGLGCALAGVLFWQFDFGAANVIATEIILIPALMLLFGITFGESEKVTVLVRTVAAIVMTLALLVNLLMGMAHAGTIAYIVVDGFLLLSLSIGSYMVTRINQ